MRWVIHTHEYKNIDPWTPKKKNFNSKLTNVNLVVNSIGKIHVCIAYKIYVVEN